ncbi:hypothetical protein D5400_08900 [Georhizobium profundi]|uniref:Uncharacterized protein n=1 Tax=Georhizobium profundi TaxID=2341112 RepID=A0A3Q8XPY5_9HYPH|nr:hypothetical protein [Georhizobium profundi]AZN71371.1 hypothetical protein D5400_08900 [Georhizobium profundi]
MSAGFFIVEPNNVPQTSGSDDLAKLAALLETRLEQFIAMPAGSAVAACAQAKPVMLDRLATHPVDLLIAVDGAGRRERRMLATEGLRFLDPTAELPIVMDRLSALAALRMPVVAACGENWRWALVRAMAEMGRLETLITGLKLPKRPLPVVPMAVLDLFANGGMESRPAPRILVVGRIEASVSLYFDGLPPETARMLRFIEAEALVANVALLETVDAIIIVRDLERCHDLGLLSVTARLDIPRVWFIDDNPLVLAREDYHWAFYSEKRLTRLLEGFTGIFASTDALADALRHLHQQVFIFPPVLDRRLIPQAQPVSEELTVALAGGGFRSEAFQRDILPALHAVQADKPVHLVAPKSFAAAPQQMPKTTFLEPRQSFPQFVRAWRQGKPNVLVHPRSATENAPYKTPNALLVGLYLDAVPIVHADEPAYVALPEHPGFVKARTGREYQAAFAELMDPVARRTRLAALLELCESLFGGRTNEAALVRFMGSSRPPRPITKALKLGLPFRRAAGRIDRLFRQARHKLRR